MHDKELVSEGIKTKLEYLMLELPSSSTESERRNYLAGIIDTYEDLGVIDEETRGELYAEYCF